MHTAAYNVGVASDRRRHKNVTSHILCSGKNKREGDSGDL